MFNAIIYTYIYNWFTEAIPLTCDYWGNRMEQVCLDTKSLVEILLKIPVVKDEGYQLKVN